jgi:hypothetical protein
MNDGAPGEGGTSGMAEGGSGGEAGDTPSASSL